MVQLLKENPTTNDIIKFMLEHHEQSKRSYDWICPAFNIGNAMAIPIDIYSFLKESIGYMIEDVNNQTVRSIPVLLTDGHGDSKHYAMFAAGILDALRRKGSLCNDIKSIKYRFVGEKEGRDVHHCFIVLNDQFSIDPLLKFDEVRPWAIVKDFEI